MDQSDRFEAILPCMTKHKSNVLMCIDLNFDMLNKRMRVFSIIGVLLTAKLLECNFNQMKMLLWHEIDV